MGHHISALVIASPWSEAARATFDLVAVPLDGVTIFHINHYYSAYWQARLAWPGLLEAPQGGLFPNEAVLAHIVAQLVGRPDPTFGIIVTDYFGGAGEQWAALYTRTHRSTPDDASINSVLRLLGVIARDGLDEFDTVGLSAHRSDPDELEKYVSLCDELGA